MVVQALRSNARGLTTHYLLDPNMLCGLVEPKWFVRNFSLVLGVTLLDKSSRIIRLSLATSW